MDDKGIQTLRSRDIDGEPAREQCAGNHPSGGNCAEMLTAEMSRCPVCDTYTIFRYSKIWKRTFCNEKMKTPFAAQAAYFKAQDIDKRTPKTKLGKRLLEKVGKSVFGHEIVQFKTLADAARWRKIEQAMTYEEIREVFGWGLEPNEKGYVKRGYGLLAYILNACDKIIRERPVKVERVSAFEGLG